MLAELGHGGMSVVYRAYDGLLEREVALKLLKLSEDEPRNLLFLQQEFRAMSRLRHPRLVQVFDYGLLESGSSYFTMELLGGEDLSSVGSLPLASTFRLLLSIADVLAFMHARGYVHRDVKPANVRVLPTAPGDSIDVKLMDFGLAAQVGHKNAAVAGTLAYLAPEAWLGSPTDVRGDLYALGVLAYEISTGQLPFEVSTGVQLLKHKTERPRDLREICPDIPAEFARLVGDLLAPEPTNRPASAMEVVARLSEFADTDFNPDPTIYLRTPALVGRARELAELRNAVAAAHSGKPNPTVIVGPAGAGKTRLLDEALLEIGMHGAIVARANGHGFAAEAYDVLQALVAPLLHLPSAEVALSRVGGIYALGMGRPRIHGAAIEQDLDPVAARRALHLALATFLDEITKHRSIVLAIDDIHLADAASIEALISVIATGLHGNIAIIATKRAGECASQSLAHLLTLSRRLEVDRMTREQVGEVIIGALGPVTPSPSLLDALESTCSGNVYFVLEILRDLAARGKIERRRTRVELPDTLDVSELPQSLSEALERRIAQLSPSALTLARIGAVVGRAIDFDLGHSLMETSAEEFLDAIDELRQKELADVHERQLRIQHPRLREVLYQGLASAERQALHARVAQVICRRGGEEQVRAAELGHHFAEAGDARRAIEYLVRAGDTRYQGFAYFDAREAYLRAFELLPAASLWRRRELELKLNDRLGRICFYHDHKRGPEYLERARRYHLRYGLLWAIIPISRVLGATVAVAVCVTLTVVLNTLRLKPRALKSTIAKLLDSFAATTYLSNCYTYSGRLQSALDAAEQLLPLVYSAQRLPRVGYLMARVYTLLLMNRLDEAAAGSEEALKILEADRVTPISEHDRVHATGGALITRLWVDLTRGYTLSSPWWKPLEAYVRQHPTALLESWLMEVRVFVAFRQGKVAETEQAWHRFVEKASQAEVVFVQSKSKVWLGMTYLDAGRTGEAQDIADEVIRVGRSLENPLILGLGLLLRGMALHNWEQLEDAQDCLEEAAGITSQPEAACWELHQSILLALATLALDRNDLERAKNLVNRVDERNATLTLTHDLHRCRAHKILGSIALAEGAPGLAIVDLQKAHALSVQLEDAFERAKTAHLLAKAFRASNDRSKVEAYELECQQLLAKLGNAHQLRKLGYSPAEPPSGDGEVSALSRVIQLVSGSGSGVTTGQHPVAIDAAPPRSESAQGHSTGAAGQLVRDETLVAADSRIGLLPNEQA